MKRQTSTSSAASRESTVGTTPVGPMKIRIPTPLSIPMIPNQDDRSCNDYDPESNTSLRSKHKRFSFAISSIPSPMSYSTQLPEISSFNWRMLKALHYLIFFAAIYFACHTQYELDEKAQLLLKATKEHNDLFEILREKERDLDRTHDDFTQLSLKLNAVVPHHQFVDVRSEEERTKIRDTVINRYDAQTARIENMKTIIQENDKKYLEEK